jgi:hypothetical protein
VGADLANDCSATVDADSHLRPIRVLFRQLRKLPLKREGGAGRAQAWSGWSPRLLNEATTPSPMNFSTSPPNSRVISGAAAPQYALSTAATSAGVRALSEGRETNKVAEEHTDFLVAFSGGR